MRNRPSLVRIAVVALSVASTTSCSGAKNYEQAYFSKHGSGYLVELKGKRYLLAHDPVSAILGKTSEETYEIEIPRIDGTIDGSEIRVERGSYKLQRQHRYLSEQNDCKPCPSQYRRQETGSVVLERPLSPEPESPAFEPGNRIDENEIAQQ